MGMHDRTTRIISAFIFSRLRVRNPSFHSQCCRLNHALSGAEEEVQLETEASAGSAESSCVDPSTWKAVDSRVFGIRRHMIPTPTWMVLKLLRQKGFEAYLVGGCVRDLVSKRIPKDFDVITTAQLKEIHRIFHRSYIVGRRFPICLVNVRGLLVEVSSFDTAGKPGKKNNSNHLPPTLDGFDKKDFIRWRNSMDRDFTINSLFFDPFVGKIYDYTNGIRDLRLRKVKTVSPAQSSFEEDCARILRGLRIAARLGLTFSKDTAVAIKNLYLSIMDLDKQRLMMELNFMLAYGAAEPSLRLLKRYKVLEILLPVHAAYLNQQIHCESTQSSYMLLKLFSCVDKLLACDRPSHCCLWVGLLAFHLALANKPQDARVIWAFSSFLYHGQWSKAVEFARKQARMPVKFSPEILEGSLTKSDDELAEEVTSFASHVVSSISSLTNEESLLESMNKYPLSPCSGVVLVSNRVAQTVEKLFNVLLDNIESYAKERVSVDIDYGLLSDGNVDETRFVLGKVIMDTMTSGIVQERRPVMAGEDHLPDLLLKLQHKLHKEKHQTPSVNVKHRQMKYVREQKIVVEEKILEVVEEKILESSLKQEQRHEEKRCEPRSSLFGNSDGGQVMVEKEQLLEFNPKQEQKAKEKCCKPLSSLFV